MNNLFYFWLIISVIFFVIEILTPGVFFFSCLGIGALLAMIISLFWSYFILQGIVFAISSVLVIYFLRPILTKYFVKQDIKSNVDSLIGQEGVVVEEIKGKIKSGLVKVNNELWRAISEKEIKKDEIIVVVKVDGSHLIVERK